jgi:hypothetical protein
MKLNGSKQMRAALLSAALLTGLPFFIACGGDSTEEQQQIQTIQVRITDHQIEMPAELPTGMAKFEIVNAGTREHSFGVTGPSGDLKLEKSLKPGETGELEMILDVGTHRVYNPLDPSQGAMQMALNVNPPADSHRG